jgi:succinate-acetate transporter protein
MSQEAIAPRPPATRVPPADPGAWAVLAFATTSFMLGLYNAGWVNPLGVALVIPVAFIFGGAVQLIVAVLEVFRGNVFGAAVFGTFGPFWIIYGLIENSFAAKVAAAAGKAAAAGAVASGVTVFLAVFAVLTFFFLIASLRTDAVLVAVIGLLLVALVLLALGVHSGSTGLVHTSGYLTLLFALLGWYHGAADVICFTFGRRLLPVGSLSR